MRFLSSELRAVPMTIMKKIVLMIVCLLDVATAQFGFHAGNFIGAGWSGGSWNADLAQVASTPAKGHYDGLAKHHDIDMYITGSNKIADERAVERSQNAGNVERFVVNTIAQANNAMGHPW